MPDPSSRLPMNSRNFGDDRTFNPTCPTDPFHQHNHHHMQPSIPLYGNQQVHDGNSAIFVATKVKLREQHRSDDKIPGSKAPSKMLRGNSDSLGSTPGVCSFYRKRKIKCSSRLSGKYPCHQCSERGMNCNSAILWVNQGEYLSPKSKSHHSPTYLASESGGSDFSTRRLINTEQSTTNFGDANRKNCGQGLQEHSDHSQALDPRDRQVKVKGMKKSSSTHSPIYYTLTSLPLINSCLQN